jgi:hypothetical protein
VTQTKHFSLSVIFHDDQGFRTLCVNKSVTAWRSFILYPPAIGYFVANKICTIIPNYNQKMHRFLNLFIFTDDLHISCGSSAHHQEHKTVHTASGIVTVVIELNRLLINLYTKSQGKTCIFKMFVRHYSKHVERLKK